MADVLAVLDYPGRRPEAPVTALGLENMLPVLAEPLPLAVTGPAYAAALTMPADAPLLAYCAASALAVHLTHRLESAPPLVLFDPMPTTDDDVTRAYVTAIGQVPGGSDTPELPDDPELLLRTVRGDLARRAETALRAQGLDDDVIAGPVARFAGQHTAYLAYLLAGRGPLPRAPLGPVLRVLSRDHPAHDGWLPPGELTTVRIDSDRAGLTAHEATRAAVLSFLSTRRDHR